MDFFPQMGLFPYMGQNSDFGLCSKCVQKNFDIWDTSLLIPELLLPMLLEIENSVFSFKRLCFTRKMDSVWEYKERINII